MGAGDLSSFTSLKLPFVSAFALYTRHVSPPPIGCASLPKRALKASPTCPAGIGGIDAVVGGAVLCDGTGGDGGSVLGPKISVRVDGDGEIRPVDGTAENSEFCVGAWACAGNGSVATKTRKSPNAGHSRPQMAAVAGALCMTLMFSAQIEAISSRLAACLRPR